LDLTKSRAEGLSPADAAQRLAEHGPNSLPAARQRSVFRMFFDQLADVMILVLIGAAVVSGIVGDATDTIAIIVIVMLNAVIGFVQEYRADKAMAALKRMSAPMARVRRDGAAVDLAAEGVVVGDIVLLEAGNIVPADLRLIETAELRVAEAALTGESEPIAKSREAIQSPSLPIADRTNMAWKGTLVANGRGVGIVVATGSQTELGRIASLLDGTKSAKTPLQSRLARFSLRLAVAVLGVCAIVFVAGLLRGEPPELMFLTAVSLAVAAIPEALPAVVIISLALGAARMARHKALVRRLPAVETLGSVTWICTDKTGTLTENRMRTEEFTDTAGVVTESPSPALLTAMALVNDAAPNEAGTIVGDPTETALYEGATSRGFERLALEVASPRVAERPFDSVRMRMATAHQTTDGIHVCVKGAPEAVLGRCTAGADPTQRDALQARADHLAASGLRVLAFAEKRIEALPGDIAELEEALTFLGFVGLMDPPREEARQAIGQCREAGIVPVMMTGDHPATARAIGTKIGMLGADDRVVTGSELAAMDDAELAEHVKEIRIFARVDPEQKIRVVSALQAHGEFVAMTGDGVNDAPALKGSNIGIAMGKSGTDVAREAADLVLLDDNFATIVSAIREGRRIFDNIRKFIKYTMTSNAGEIWTIFLAPFLGLPIPLLPIHILWVNLVTDGLPGLALASEPAERDVMQRPPRAPTESIFAHGMWQHILWVGLLMAAVCLGLQAYGIATGAHWQTMVFTVLCLSQLGHAMAVRSERDSAITVGWRSNPFFSGTVLVTVGLQMATIYVPAFHDVFKTESLSLFELAICLGASTIVFFAVELEKAFIRRGHLYGESSHA